MNSLGALTRIAQENAHIEHPSVTLASTVLAPYVVLLRAADAPTGRELPHLLKWPAAGRELFGVPAPKQIQYSGYLFDLVFAEDIHEPRVLRRIGLYSYQRLYLQNE